MRVDVDFELLDTYMSVYGVYVFSGDTLRIYLLGGLGVPSGLRSIFPRRYFYDPWSGNKYSEITEVNGLLVGCLEGSEDKVLYEDKAIGAEVLKYEYVGGCWFVFEDVSRFSGKIARYIDADKKSEGDGVLERLDLPKATGGAWRSISWKACLTFLQALDGCLGRFRRSPFIWKFQKKEKRGQIRITGDRPEWHLLTR